MDTHRSLWFFGWLTKEVTLWAATTEAHAYFNHIAWKPTCFYLSTFHYTRARICRSKRICLLYLFNLMLRYSVSLRQWNIRKADGRFRGNLIIPSYTYGCKCFFSILSIFETSFIRSPIEFIAILPPLTITLERFFIASFFSINISIGHTLSPPPPPPPPNNIANLAFVTSPWKWEQARRGRSGSALPERINRPHRQTLAPSL